MSVYPWVQVSLRNPEDGTGSLELELKAVVRLLMWVWEPNISLLQDQYLLLRAEPSL